MPDPNTTTSAIQHLTTMSSPRHLCGGGRPDSKETPTATMKLRFNLQEKQEQNMAGTEAKQRTLDLTKKLWVLREDICAWKP
ncbi:hypothetical protein TSUD_176230 [Trifolium subterraneum]|uniref:Uncharacterized protein n=1 Tax=Trifolium subterraneum TaxID=3900 RepID=A0A2Z6LPL9_TRISU|nr:hypothetical protein TSUD_176230 [Trifolium subterraneum]